MACDQEVSKQPYSRLYWYLVFIRRCHREIYDFLVQIIRCIEIYNVELLNVLELKYCVRSIVVRQWQC